MSTFKRKSENGNLPTQVSYNMQGTLTKAANVTKVTTIAKNNDHNKQSLKKSFFFSLQNVILSQQ